MVSMYVYLFEISIFNYNIFIHFIDNNSDTWTIEYIEVNDIGNDLKIKYLPDKYWYNLEQSNNILLVANKSMKQIKPTLSFIQAHLLDGLRFKHPIQVQPFETLRIGTQRIKI
jgi:hypothetical protein